MKMLWSLLLVTLILSPAYAEGAARPVFNPGSDFTRLVKALSRIPEPTGLLALNTAQTRSRVLGLARISTGVPAKQATASLPSFAIKSAGDSRQASNVSNVTGTSTSGVSTAASAAPVSFSFAASADRGQSHTTYNEYRGGVFMAAPF